MVALPVAKRPLTVFVPFQPVHWYPFFAPGPDHVTLSFATRVGVWRRGGVSSRRCWQQAVLALTGSASSRRCWQQAVLAAGGVGNTHARLSTLFGLTLTMVKFWIGASASVKTTPGPVTSVNTTSLISRFLMIGVPVAFVGPVEAGERHQHRRMMINSTREHHYDPPALWSCKERGGERW